ncbi:hypothetical protein PR202_gb27530 [Eleusine coracana subsp. coracana]|uniref:DUF1618 domain-containing protein n=1 Tax=Eleusine coracana subsp. coracana TaxID=191504 RepID=A0AAV5FS43_ELECO|nr:hypothetical protein QOZ80_6AG0540940 [Eleusine coracana subsp. coracana]GJN38484.1 hypothetical protein PR202_gb27530 [Eleusine coracana subsp. coracana]
MEDNRGRRGPSCTDDFSMLKLLKIPAPIHRDEDLLRPPDSILLDPYGYISARENDTTARGRLSDGKRIQVTFWAARPPRVSCFTVHCPALSVGSFTDFPKILSTEDDLVLLRVSIRSQRDHHREAISTDRFIYQAGTRTKRPELHRISMPADIESSAELPVLLRCRARDMYYIVMLCRRSISLQRFDVYLFNSKARDWRIMAMNPAKEINFYYSSKAITIGGKFGSVGWVDLWHGILIYDVFLNSNQLRYIALPPPVVPKLLRGPPLVVRDIVVIDGHIKCFDMQAYMKADINTEYSYIPDGLEAVTCKMNLSKLDSGWENDCEIKISDVKLNELLLTTEVKVKDRKLTLANAVYPALSLHYDGVVYIMNQLQHYDYKAWVIAVDMRHGALKDVAYFGSGRP